MTAIQPFMILPAGGEPTSRARPGQPTAPGLAPAWCPSNPNMDTNGRNEFLQVCAVYSLV